MPASLGGRDRAFWWRFVLGGLVVCVASTAHGHTGFHRSSLRALIKPDRLHLSVQVVLPTGAEARRFRQAWDLDGDQRIDRAEREAALMSLHAQHCDSLVVSVDGRERVCDLRSADGGGLIGPVARDDSVSVSFQLEIALPLAPGPHSLVIRKRSPSAGHVPVALQAGRGVALGASEEPRKRRELARQVVSVIGATQPLAVTFRRALADPETE